MAELKTKPTGESVGAHLKAIEDPQLRADARALAKLMREATGCRAKMWGTSIIGYDQYHFRYASGREGDWPITGFSPRKRETSVYFMTGFSKYARLMKKLGKYRTGRSCLYIRKLEDIDRDVLRELIERSVTDMRKKYPRASAQARKTRRPA